MMSEKNSLESHKLVRRLITNLEPVIRESADHLAQLAKDSGKLRNEGGRTLPEPYPYHHEVFRYAQRLLNGVRTMKDVHTYLLRFPQPATYTKQGIGPDRWIEYHYSTYVVTVCSLYDIALILTNVVFRLGIPVRQCKDDIITGNRWVERTRVKSALDSLNGHVKPYREPRNLYAHRGEVPDLEHLDLLKLLTLVQPHAPALVDPGEIPYLYDRDSGALRNKIQAECASFEKAISDLFDALLPIYEVWAKTIGPSNTTLTT